MSLDVYLKVNDEVVYSSNITHNLNRMADEAGIYEALWRPHRLKPYYFKKVIMKVQDEC